MNDRATIIVDGKYSCCKYKLMLRCSARCTSIQVNDPTSELRRKKNLLQKETRILIYIYAAHNQKLHK